MGFGKMGVYFREQEEKCQILSEKKTNTNRGTGQFNKETGTSKKVPESSHNLLISYT